MREEKENRTKKKHTQKKKKKNLRLALQLPIAHPSCLEEETPATLPQSNCREGRTLLTEQKQNKKNRKN
jgi:hypothetical protein